MQRIANHTQESKVNLEGPMLNSLLILFACNSTDLSYFLSVEESVSPCLTQNTLPNKKEKHQ